MWGDWGSVENDRKHSGWSAVRTWTGTKKTLTEQNVRHGGDQINIQSFHVRWRGSGTSKGKTKKHMCGSGERRASEMAESKSHVLFLAFCQKIDMLVHVSFLGGRISQLRYPRLCFRSPWTLKSLDPYLMFISQL